MERFSFLSVSFASYLLVLVARSEEGTSVEYRYQLYAEEDDRMEVRSQYLDIRQVLPSATKLKFKYAQNALSGATPTGAYDGRSSADGWAYADIKDKRDAYSIAVEQEVGEYLLEFEYTDGGENDYESESYAIQGKGAFNDGNTEVSVGFSYDDDVVIGTGFNNFSVKGERADKVTRSFSVGLTQILSRDSVVELSLGYVASEGYLNDSYRNIAVEQSLGRRGVVFLAQPENRPRARDSFTVSLKGRKYFESIDGALLASYRFFSDNHGIDSHTYNLRWNQQITGRFTVSPFARYYRQSSADYFRRSLLINDPLSLVASQQGGPETLGSGPFYSADYRLSEFDAWTYGVNLSYQLSDSISAECQFERYQMLGGADSAPHEFYVTANTLTLGLSIVF